jgi:hypothetical protein
MMLSPLRINKDRDTLFNNFINVCFIITEQGIVRIECVILQ